MHNSDALQEFPALIRNLQHQLSQPLPGPEYQFRMAHLKRISEMPLRTDVRNAAVLILLYQDSEVWKIVMIRRRSIAGDVHGGQISFPGGRARADESISQTALRESFEEIGSPQEDIVVLGQLTTLHIPVSNHFVYPVVGYLDNYEGWKAQESEVDFILEVPLAHIHHPAARTTTSIRLKDGLILSDVPCYAFDDHFIWGATAMMLSEFNEVILRMGGTGER